MWIAHFVAEKRLFLYRFDGNINFMKQRFLRLKYVDRNVSVHEPYTNRTAVGTCVYNGRYLRTSGRRERAPSRTDWINNDSQKAADSSGKAVSTD